MQLTGDTTIYFDQNYTVGSAGMSLNYIGSHNLTFESSSTSAVTLTTGGLAGGFGSGKTITLGNSNAALDIDLENGSSLTTGSGSTFFAENLISGGTLSEYGSGTLTIDNLASMDDTTVNIDSGRLKLDGQDVLSASTVNLQGGTLTAGANNALDYSSSTGTTVNIYAGTFDLNGTNQSLQAHNGNGGGNRQ